MNEPVGNKGIRALSLLQPWASLMSFGEKRVETRSWQTPYRGRIAIAASAKWNTSDIQLSVSDPEFVAAWMRHGVRTMRELPLGAILCVGNLTDCVKTEYFDCYGSNCGESEASFGNYAPGRYAWVFTNIIRLREPIPIKGALGVYSLSHDVALRIEEELSANATA